MNRDHRYMKQVLRLALKGLGLVSPNPLVGALIVNKGRVLATGYHARFGAAHAEIDALKKIKFKAEGATLYCNLEPCCHQGKTPPCVDRVIASGIKRVVIAQKDPNPKVNGRSIKILKKHGVEVVVGVCEEEAKYVNRFFNTYHEKKRPYIIAKLALSTDFKIGLLKNTEKKRVLISSENSRYLVHYWRAVSDAILIGKNTAFNDNPLLTVRLTRNNQQKLFFKTFLNQQNGRKLPTISSDQFKALSKKKPMRVLLSHFFDYPESFISKSSCFGKYLIAGTSSVRFNRLIAKKKNVILYKNRPRGLSGLLKKLGEQSLLCIYIEGGAEVLKSFINAQLIDEYHFYFSPKIMGTGVDASFLRSILLADTRKKVYKIGVDRLYIC